MHRFNIGFCVLSFLSNIIRADQPNMPRSRSWVFTINNPDVAERWVILPRKVDYICWQLEQGEQGTPHLQGCFHMDAASTLTGAKRTLNCDEAHLEIMNGTWDQSIRYSTKCCKDCYEQGRTEGDCPECDRLEGPWELGTRPAEQGKRTDLEAIRECIDKGEDDTTIAKKHFGPWCRYRKSFIAYRELTRDKRKPDDPLDVVFLGGPPGYGKSYYAHTALTEWGLAQGYKGVYRKAPQTKWWDHYMGQQIVILDEMDGSWMPWNTLLQLLDKYPVDVELKGETAVDFSAKLVIMTSNKEPEDWYDKKPNEALIRRIHHRAYFDVPRQPSWVKGGQPWSALNETSTSPTVTLQPPPYRAVVDTIVIPEDDELLNEEELLLFAMIEED